MLKLRTVCLFLYIVLNVSIANARVCFLPGILSGDGCMFEQDISCAGFDKTQPCDEAYETQSCYDTSAKEWRYKCSCKDSNYFHLGAKYKCEVEPDPVCGCEKEHTVCDEVLYPYTDCGNWPNSEGADACYDPKNGKVHYGRCDCDEKIYKYTCDEKGLAAPVETAKCKASTGEILYSYCDCAINWQSNPCSENASECTNQLQSVEKGNGNYCYRCAPDTCSDPAEKNLEAYFCEVPENINVSCESLGYILDEDDDGLCPNGAEGLICPFDFNYIYCPENEGCKYTTKGQCEGIFINTICEPTTMGCYVPKNCKDGFTKECKGQIQKADKFGCGVCVATTCEGYDENYHTTEPEGMDCETITVKLSGGETQCYYSCVELKRPCEFDTIDKCQERYPYSDCSSYTDEDGCIAPNPDSCGEGFEKVSSESTIAAKDNNYCGSYAWPCFTDIIAAKDNNDCGLYAEPCFTDETKCNSYYQKIDSNAYCMDTGMMPYDDNQPCISFGCKEGYCANMDNYFTCHSTAIPEDGYICEDKIAGVTNDSSFGEADPNTFKEALCTTTKYYNDWGAFKVCANSYKCIYADNVIELDEETGEQYLYCPECYKKRDYCQKMTKHICKKGDKDCWNSTEDCLFNVQTECYEHGLVADKSILDNGCPTGCKKCDTAFNSTTKECCPADKPVYSEEYGGCTPDCTGQGKVLNIKSGTCCDYAYNTKDGTCCPTDKPYYSDSVGECFNCTYPEKYYSKLNACYPDCGEGIDYNPNDEVCCNEHDSSLEVFDTTLGYCVDACGGRDYNPSIDDCCPETHPKRIGNADDGYECVTGCMDTAFNPQTKTCCSSETPYYDSLSGECAECDGPFNPYSLTCCADYQTYNSETKECENIENSDGEDSDDDNGGGCGTMTCDQCMYACRSGYSSDDLRENEEYIEESCESSCTCC